MDGSLLRGSGAAYTPGKEDREQGGGGGAGESLLNPHSHLSLWVEGMETSHAVWLSNLIDFIL